MITRHTVEPLLSGQYNTVNKTAATSIKLLRPPFGRPNEGSPIVFIPRVSKRDMHKGIKERGKKKLVNTLLKQVTCKSALKTKRP